ncbi:MAG: DUF2283 domain-containing protein [Candidatus Kapabacteria bacterium]|nr:DUF2283 domain-containing protein [Candidatus Kapabacteria bacterium]
MASQVVQASLNEFYGILPHLMKLPTQKFWVDYDKEVDVLYINYMKPQRATDSEMLDNGVLIRYRDEDIIGITILDASTRGN